MLITVIAAVSFTLASWAQATEGGLDQNWTAQDLKDWHERSQGSRLIPLSWFMALEMGDSEEPFLSDGNVTHYGYTPRDLVFKNRTYRLPRGFVVDVTDDTSLTFSHQRWMAGQSSIEPWIGMNCSACHTANISYKGLTWEVQGGPTLADFQGFFNEFRKSLAATRADDAKFVRFASKVLHPNDSAVNRAALRQALDRLNQFLVTSAALNYTDLEYGPGRLDAVGHILNRIAQLNGATAPTPNPSDAPVSYPFLWNVPQHSKVQWNGIAPKISLGNGGLDIGALARNAAEAIGVFSDVKFVHHAPPTGFISSVNVDNLQIFEETLERLRPPRWPTQFGAVDTACIDKNTCLYGHGKELFQTHCEGCHAQLARDALHTPIKIEMKKISEVETPGTIGTDPWMACNAYQFSSDSGLLEGALLNSLNGLVGKKTDLATQLGVTTRKVLLNKGKTITDLAAARIFHVEHARNLMSVIPRGGQLLPFGVETRLFTGSKLVRLKECYQQAPAVAILAYKPRPLTGIWASAPYLHNGSVSSLYQLMLPPSQRKTEFNTGTTEFDPKEVGFLTDESATNRFKFKTSLMGNSNQGHDYGTANFNDHDRMSLVEYMKSL
jgi:hypothetical protein